MSPSVSPGMPARSYENLQGGQGRSIYYRAERLRPRALMLETPPTVEVASRPVRVYDLSATGLSYWAQAPDDVSAAGARVPVRIRLGDVEAFSAQGEIVRHQPVGGRTKVALRFLDDQLVATQLRRLHDRVEFERAAEEGLDRYRAVPPAYRSACSDARLFFDHWRQLLDRREAQLRDTEPPATLSERLHEVERSVEPRMREEWGDVHAALNEASKDITEGAALVASKRFTEALLTPVLRASPFLWRCYVKPQGYPGDFMAMTWMYEGQRQGETIFGRVLDQLGLDERLAATVRVRKRLLVRHIAECVEEATRRGGRVDASGAVRPIRIVTIGAGPAREIVDYLDQTESSVPIEFLLIDQDEQALEFAAGQAGRAALRHGGRVSVQLRHVSFSQLFELPDLLGEVEGADMIYSAGLFDYLREAPARALLHGCFGLLGEGGRLVVGNAASVPGLRWVPEFLLDWTMLYRTESEMSALGEGLSGSLKVERDDSDTWLFLVARNDTTGKGAHVGG